MVRPPRLSGFETVVLRKKDEKVTVMESVKMYLKQSPEDRDGLDMYGEVMVNKWWNQSRRMLRLDLAFDRMDVVREQIKLVGV